jgi:hypothetical protein
MTSRGAAARLSNEGDWSAVCSADWLFSKSWRENISRIQAALHGRPPRTNRRADALNISNTIQYRRVRGPPTDRAGLESFSGTGDQSQCLLVEQRFGAFLMRSPAPCRDDQACLPRQAYSIDVTVMRGSRQASSVNYPSLQHKLVPDHRS